MVENDSVFVQGSLFEEDYLLRTLGPLVRSADIALTELIANAWDAGAAVVDVMIPDNYDEKLVISDDGVGLSPAEFHSRWMTLGYNRAKHQKDRVEFPKGREGSRSPYGRNGIGRHGLLCFNDQYAVITCKEGTESEFLISTHSKNQPFVIEKESTKTSDRHGTRLEVVVKRNLLKADRIREIISARFLHDPQFLIRINGGVIPLEEHTGLIDSTVIEVNDGISLEVFFVDTQKSARSTLYQGVALWQGRRLVGEPSWILGGLPILDGRTRFAKRYTFIVKTNDLIKFVKDDWTGFIECDIMNEVYSAISSHVSIQFDNLARTSIGERKVTLRNRFKDDINELSFVGKYEIDQVVDHVIKLHPTTSEETLGIVFEAFINLKKTESGISLLQKISQLPETDIEGLNRLLEQWTIKDALCVLDEIDRRMSVIEAISKLSGDPKTDELKVLHPLVTEARWLFGPEYDSEEYVSNRQLKTAAKEIFHIQQDIVLFDNPKKRPDIVVMADGIISVTGTEEMSTDAGLIEMGRVLIIELKKGGSTISRENRDQAIHYVEDFIACRHLTGNPSFFAYVVGEKVAERVAGRQKILENGYVYVTTYSQLIDTARRRLFNLGERLKERYDGIPGFELVDKIRQQDFEFDNQSSKGISVHKSMA